jgi:two-component system LytT family response regulator
VTIRVAIVDDEPLAIERMRRLLAGEPDIQVVAECSNGAEAVAAIRSQAPDLVFLDVQMPGLDGFGVVEEVGPAAMPATIFATAFDEHALQAFDTSALDYLLKPFDPDRFARALHRARRFLRNQNREDLEARLTSMLRGLNRTRRYLDRFTVRYGRRIVFVDAAEVDWIEADGNYAAIHVGSRFICCARPSRALKSSSIRPSSCASTGRTSSQWTGFASWSLCFRESGRIRRTAQGRHTTHLQPHLPGALGTSGGNLSQSRVIPRSPLNPQAGAPSCLVPNSWRGTAVGQGAGSSTACVRIERQPRERSPAAATMFVQRPNVEVDHVRLDRPVRPHFRLSSGTHCVRRKIVPIQSTGRWLKYPRMIEAASGEKLFSPIPERLQQSLATTRNFHHCHQRIEMDEANVDRVHS